MPTSFLASYAAVGVFVLVGAGFAVFNLLLWRLLRPARASEAKLTTYECGEEPQGGAWIQFNVRFYVFALLFVVFDVEAALLLPWAVVFKEGGLMALAEGLVFLVVLGVALAYVWKKGDLAWVQPQVRS